MKSASSFVSIGSRSYWLLVRIGLVLFTTIALSSRGIAQNEPAGPPKRMKVGVALEGGGALGLAHIGVLRWFLFVATSVAAQAPLDQAWKILQAGAANSSTDQRMATIRALQLIPGDAQAASLAEKCLQDQDPQVRGAAALPVGAMGDKLRSRN